MIRTRHRRRPVYIDNPKHVIGSTIYVPAQRRKPAPVIDATSAPRNRRGLWVVLSLGTLLLAAIGGVAAAVFSPVLEIEEVVVQGNANLPDEAILERVNLVGENMLTADFDPTRAAIARLPLVAAVTIQRDWPKGVRILVRERQAWGVWEQNGVAYPIDAEGVVLGSVDLPEHGPVVRSSAKSTLIAGDRVDPEAIAAVVEIMAKLPGALGTEVEEVAFVPGKGVQVTTADGRVGVLGDSRDIAYKLAVWAASDAKAQEERIEYRVIDLRFGNRPVLQ
ncbi:MAG: cell division protein FtsQ/DivIB [Dehalococcoidia bacterium]